MRHKEHATPAASTTAIDAALSHAVALVERRDATQGALMLVALTTGLKPDVAFELTWPNVDLVEGVCVVWDEGLQALRTVPLPQIAVDALSRLPRSAANDFVFWPESTKVWPLRMAVDLDDGSSLELTGEEFSTAFLRKAGQLGLLQPIVDAIASDEEVAARRGGGRPRYAVETVAAQFAQMVRIARRAV